MKRSRWVAGLRLLVLTMRALVKEPLINYIDMLSVVRDRIRGMIERVKSLAEVLAAKPTAEFDERYGDSERLVNRAYASLNR